MSRLRAILRDTRGRVLTVLAATLAAVAVASPLAIGAGEGSTLKGGERNPSGGRALSSETQVIASNSTFGTRQSNKGSGGGAIYGCRAPLGNEGCIEASNLSNGNAFKFRFRGESGGSITTSGTNKAEAKPFTTNALGVADGLNADKVDGKDANQIVEDTLARTKIAVVSADGKIANQRGLTAAVKEDTGKYLVTADGDISKCVPNVTAYGTAPGANAALEPVGTTQLRVYTQTSAGIAADRQFAITVNC